MSNPQDSSPDFNWLNRSLSDSAVLHDGEEESPPEETLRDPALETHVTENDTVHYEPSELPTEIPSASSSGSNIHDVEISDDNILDDDAPEEALNQREPNPDDEALEESEAVSGDDVVQTNDASEPGFLNFETEASDEPTGSAEEAIAAFDLETPTPSAAFPMPITPRNPSQSRDTRSVKPSATSTPEVDAAASRSTGRIILISYASAMTILCLFLLLQLLREFRPHQLESLPDVQPLEQNESQFVPVGALLPDGHVLEFGDARRFGNILVEPLRVTYGPVEFEHHTGEASRTRPPSEESVVKLWLRLTNVSEDQSIAPLDGRLVLNREYRAGNMLTNNFLRGADLEELETMYNLPPSSEWELRGQDIGRVLEPGESFETYVATGSEHLSDIVGTVGSDQRELVWRLHLRKGYGPVGHGVTTLVEVAFNGSEIEREG